MYLLSSHFGEFTTSNYKDISPQVNACNTIFQMNNLLFSYHEDMQALLEHHDLKDTKFTKWFDANQRYPEASMIAYAELPSK